MKNHHNENETVRPVALRLAALGTASILALSVLTACSADAGDNAGSTQNTQATENQATDKSDSSGDYEDASQNTEANEGSDSSGDNEDASQNTEANEGSDSPSQESSTDETQSATQDSVTREPTRVAASFAEGISSAEVLAWVNAATGEMLNPPTDFMGLVWPIGKQLDDEPDPQVFDGDPFLEHSDVLSPSEQDEVAKYFRSWQAALVGCDPEDARDFNEGADRVERWIKGSANVATAPDPCFESRSAIVAWSADQDKTTAKQTFFHESYHGLSNYLLKQCSPILNRQEDDMNDLRWFAEGTADYFGVYMAAKDDGRDDYVQTMLKRAYLDLRGDPGMPLGANTYVQTAAMVLMIERGMITEKQIINGSLFNNCDWINTFDPAAKGIDYIFENFNKIEVSGGKYFYSDATIEG